jgi:hypothetical protein
MVGPEAFGAVAISLPSIETASVFCSEWRWCCSNGWRR